MLFQEENKLYCCDSTMRLSYTKSTKYSLTKVCFKNVWQGLHTGQNFEIKLLYATLRSANYKLPISWLKGA